MVNLALIAIPRREVLAANVQIVEIISLLKYFQGFATNQLAARRVYEDMSAPASVNGGRWLCRPDRSL